MRKVSVQYLIRDFELIITVALVLAVVFGPWLWSVRQYLFLVQNLFHFSYRRIPKAFSCHIFFFYGSPPPQPIRDPESLWEPRVGKSVIGIGFQGKFPGQARSSLLQYVRPCQVQAGGGVWLSEAENVFQGEPLASLDGFRLSCIEEAREGRCRVLQSII